MVLKTEVADQIKDLLRKNPRGLKITDIVKDIHINRNTAGRYLENLLISGQVEMRRFGMAKIYKISQRVPFSAVLSISSEFVIQLDGFLRFVFVNEPFCALVGTDSKNLLGKNIEFTRVPLIFDELFVGFIERIREAIAGEEWSGEIRFRSKGIIVFCRIAPTVFEDGRKGVSIVLEDITRRKQGEWALLESEATARALMNSPTDTIILMDTLGIILDLNETAALKFKDHGDNLVGTLADTLLPAKVAQSRRLLTTRVIETKQMIRYEDERDGRWYDTVAYPIIVDGEVTRIAMIARDITDRKKSEDALRESEERYRKLVEISPDAVFIHQDHKITYLNPAALTLFGSKNAQEILGKNILDMIHPDYRDTVRKNIENDLDGKSTPPIELHMLRVDGTSVIVEGRGVKTTINGKPAIQVALRDITGRKRAEDQIAHQARTLAILNEIIITANQASSLADLLNFFLTTTLRLLDYDAGGIYLVDEDTDTASVVHEKNLPEEFLAKIRTVARGEKPYDALFVRGEPIFTDNFPSLSPVAASSGLCSLASIPLIAGTSIIGALNIDSKKRDRVTDQEREILLVIGRELGTTIHRMVAKIEEKKQQSTGH